MTVFEPSTQASANASAHSIVTCEMSKRHHCVIQGFLRRNFSFAYSNEYVVVIFFISQRLNCNTKFKL